MRGSKRIWAIGLLWLWLFSGDVLASNPCMLSPSSSQVGAGSIGTWVHPACERIIMANIEQQRSGYLSALDDETRLSVERAYQLWLSFENAYCYEYPRPNCHMSLRFSYFSVQNILLNQYPLISSDRGFLLASVAERERLYQLDDISLSREAEVSYWFFMSLQQEFKQYNRQPSFRFFWQWFLAESELFQKFYQQDLGVVETQEQRNRSFLLSQSFIIRQNLQAHHFLKNLTHFDYDSLYDFNRNLHNRSGASFEWIDE